MKVYTTGVYDLLHRGHFTFLTKARALGDSLIVGIQSDESALVHKGRRPILTTTERVDQLRAIPFIDDVLVYDDLNQIPIYESLKPDIVVQADDWLKGGDRSLMVDYIANSTIRLILLPYTHGISTTEIKRRVEAANERRDRRFILEHVRLMPVSELSLYEKFDEQKVSRLIKKIQQDNVFTNPITVAQKDGYSIVIDGVNRLEAVKRMGLIQIPALVVSYDEVDLAANTHFKNGDRTTRMSEFGEESGERVEFSLYTKKDIIEMVQRGTMTQNGETWHKVKVAVARLRIPIDLLKSSFDFEKFLLSKIENNQIRYYPSNVYVCDEWE